MNRLAALERVGLLDTPPEEMFDRLTSLARRILNALVTLVSLVDGDRQFFKSGAGLREPWLSRRETPPRILVDSQRPCRCRQCCSVSQDDFDDPVQPRIEEGADRIAAGAQNGAVETGRSLTCSDLLILQRVDDCRRVRTGGNALLRPGNR